MNAEVEDPRTGKWMRPGEDEDDDDGVGCNLSGVGCILIPLILVAGFIAFHYINNYFDYKTKYSAFVKDEIEPLKKDVEDLKKRVKELERRGE